MLSGCSSAVAGSALPADGAVIAAERVDTALFSFTYEGIAPSGYMDQTLTISSAAEFPVVLTATPSPVDDLGAAMPGVTVDSAFGSLEGRMVVLPGVNIDILVVDGAHGSATADVLVEVASARALEFPSADGVVEVVPTDSSGMGTYDPFAVAALTLTGPQRSASSPDASKVGVRAVYLDWNRPEPGESQQADQVVELIPLTRLAAGAEVVVEVLPEVRAALQDLRHGFGSYLTYYSVDGSAAENS